jgi:hypothetical protein
LATITPRRDPNREVPVFIGDTVTAEVEILEVALTPK